MCSLKRDFFGIIDSIFNEQIGNLKINFYDITKFEFFKTRQKLIQIQKLSQKLIQILLTCV